MKTTCGLLLLLAVLASILRFGQRENEAAAVSDSDYYLDMAAVFGGDRAVFDPVYADPEQSGAHHYARPLLPFLAAWTARTVPGLEIRSAFSALNVLGSWVVAVVFYVLVLRVAPDLRHPWLPPALFLTGFPQVNWGYHILTDTLGFATAFSSAVAAWALLRWRRANPAAPIGAVASRALGLFVLQALAFLARETAWIVPVFVVLLPLWDEDARADARFALGVFAVVCIAAVPWLAYLRLSGTHAVPIPFRPGAWLDTGYALDFVVKSLVAFHVTWVLAAVALWRSRRGALAVPGPLKAWAAGALLYMAAGYAHNSLDGVGYPLRLTWALFPLVLFLAAKGTEGVEARRGRWAAVLVVLVQAGASIVGTRLDPGTSVRTAPAGARAPLTTGSRPAPP